MIIVVNDDTVPQIQQVMQVQLSLDEIITGTEFDSRVLADSQYPVTIRLSGRRVMVVRSFFDQFDRTVVDFVLFIKNGLASIEYDQAGPPGQTYQVASMTLQQLVNGANQNPNRNPCPSRTDPNNPLTNPLLPPLPWFHKKGLP